MIVFFFNKETKIDVFWKKKGRLKNIVLSPITSGFTIYILLQIDKSKYFFVELLKIYRRSDPRII